MTHDLSQESFGCTLYIDTEISTQPVYVWHNIWSAVVVHKLWSYKIIHIGLYCAWIVMLSKFCRAQLVSEYKLPVTSLLGKTEIQHLKPYLFPCNTNFILGHVSYISIITHSYKLSRLFSNHTYICFCKQKWGINGSEMYLTLPISQVHRPIHVFFFLYLSLFSFSYAMSY